MSEENKRPNRKGPRRFSGTPLSVSNSHLTAPTDSKRRNNAVEFIMVTSGQGDASAKDRGPFGAYKCHTCGKVVYAWSDTDFREISRHTNHSPTNFTAIDIPLTGLCRCGFEVRRLSEEAFIAHLSSSHTLDELFEPV